MTSRKFLTRRLRSAEKQTESRLLVGAFAPLRPMCCVVVGLAHVHCNARAPIGALNAGDSAIIETALPVQQSATQWPLGRGNALADGVAKTKLPQKPEVVWKVTIDKGAFDGTPVIADGVVYLGDMDGVVYAWKLADGTEIWTRKFESGFIASPSLRGDF